MGKFMRPSKLTPEVSVMEMTKSTLGVRTRAKTLALQSKPDYCYLQLRSRRLEKTPMFRAPRVQHKSPQPGLRAFASGPIRVQDDFPQDERIGENNLDSQQIQRAIRESTPSNLIIDVDNISTPGSSTKYPILTAENQRPRSSILTNIPSTREVDDLFAHFEQQQQQQRFFMEKYNFDIINDIPLPGRYEWVKVNP